jgi:hypothetical protein
MEDNTKVKPCPEFPYFGAWYPDATCIGGTLQDLDDCDSDGNIFLSKDVPCPFCNTESFLKYEVGSIGDYETEQEYKDYLIKVQDWMQSIQQRYA